MSDVQWNKIILECGEAQNVRTAAELCLKQRIGIQIVAPELLENAIINRGLMKAGYKILTTISNPNQKTPGANKLNGSNADIFDADGFQIAPMATDNPTILLNDLREISAFLRSNLSQELIIGWDLSGISLKDKETLQLLDMIAKGYRPNFLQFNGEQGLICEIAKKTCATKTVLPHDADIESDHKVVSTPQAVKLAK